MTDGTKAATEKESNDTAPEFVVTYPVVEVEKGYLVNVAMTPDMLRRGRLTREHANEAALVIEAMDKKITVLISALSLYEIELRDAEKRRDVRKFLSKLCTNINNLLLKLQLKEPKPRS